MSRIIRIGYKKGLKQVTLIVMIPFYYGDCLVRGINLYFSDFIQNECWLMFGH